MAWSEREKMLGAILVVVAIGGAWYMTGGFQFQAEGGGPLPPGFASTASFTQWQPLIGSAATSNVNYRFLNMDNSLRVAETQVTADPQTQGTMPNSFEGYLIVGNDAALGTDRGSEVYYSKKYVKWTNDDSPELGQVQLFNESTITWRGYDSGVEESTTNLTIGSGASYTRLDLEYEAMDNGCIGNPDFKKLAIGFNYTNATVLSRFDWIKPKTGYYVGTDSVPEYTAGLAFQPTIYVLPEAAFVCDSGTYKIPIEIKAKAGSDPAVQDYAFAHMFDWSYFLDDTGKISSGWEDKSNIAADVDVGLDTAGQAKAVTFA